MENWTREQWQKSELGDVRRNDRAIKLGLALVSKPHGSLPAQTEKWAHLKGAYRLLSSKEVSHEKLQKVHWKNTLEKAENSKNTLLLVQDTSELDYSNKKATKSLGSIGNHRGRGLVLHSCLAVEFDTQPINILGLANQKVWVRENISKRIETRKQRHERNHEGKLWEQTLNGISRTINLNHRIVSVGDRGNDSFSFMKFCKDNSWNYVFRVKYNRVITQDKREFNLFDHLKKFESKSQKTIRLTDNDKEIELKVGWEKIKISSPKNLYKKSERIEIEIWCIRCWNDENKIEWNLFTNLEIKNQQDALEKIEWYKARWLIEEYHKCLKTGCNIEKRNLQTAHALKSLLGFLGIVATKLLEIKFLAKQNRSRLAAEFADPISLKIICARFKLSESTITAQEFWHSLARLGGFIGRKSDGDPGWQTLWSGWLRLIDMISGVESLKICG